jgi:predicted dehydrogenase
VTRVAVIGAGRLGSRHLQALAALRADAAIHVIDPSQAALETAADLFQRAGDAGRRHHVSYGPDIDRLPAEIDVAIVATTADVRRPVIEALVRRSRVRYLVLEKFLFQALDDYERVAELLEAQSIEAWVNCPRRMYRDYHRIRAAVRGTLGLRLEGIAWGLAGNTIHPLDLMAFLCGSTAYEIVESVLSKDVVPAPRSGFVEITGSLRAVFDGRHSVEVISRPHGEMPIRITIDDDARTYNVDEPGHRLTTAEKADGRVVSETCFAVPLQSELTNLVVDELIDDGRCVLTPFAESVALHLPLLDSLRRHFNEIGRPEWAERCPIT